MDAIQYGALLKKFTILEARYQSYLSDTPTNVVQGDRGALKKAMNEFKQEFSSVVVPEGVDEAEIIKEALASLVPEKAVPNKVAYNDTYDEQGNLVESEEVDLTDGAGDALENAIEEQGAPFDDESTKGKPVDTNGAEADDTENDLPETQDAPIEEVSDEKVMEDAQENDTEVQDSDTDAQDGEPTKETED